MESATSAVTRAAGHSALRCQPEGFANWLKHDKATGKVT